MNQVHGDEVLEVSEIVENPTCDALITTQHGIALAVLVADCIPLLLSSSNVIAAVHVGRRGLANSIAIKTVEKMRALGATDIKANLGPSICGRCYEVSPEIADDFKNFNPTPISTSRAGTLALDLPRALIADLVEIGVQVQSSDICTLEDSNYFSYRRNNLTGRTAGVIWL